MTDSDVRQLREELGEFKIETVQRLARIEERLELLVPRPEAGKMAAVADNGSTQALSKVSVGLVELGKEVLRLMLAVVATLIALKQGGGTP